jgi:RNase P/RNase MRP subunit p29
MKILRDEFIGKYVEIGKYNGKIIDETKNMILIRDEKNNQKKFIKKDHTFIFCIDDKKFVIKGEDICERPEERIKLVK